jgi:hypothetical protein
MGHHFIGGNPDTHLAGATDRPTAVASVAIQSFVSRI